MSSSKAHRIAGSTTYSDDLATAVTGANKLCQTAATAVGLGGNWNAIIQQPNGENAGASPT